jgi:hypothetical protein
LGGWASKATPSERAASKAVGGFSDNERHLYHQGLEHLYHTHQRVGAYTIRQVVDQERSREYGRERRRPKSAETPNYGDVWSALLGLIIFVVVIGGVVALLARRRPDPTFRVTPFDDRPYRLGPLVPVSPGSVIPLHGETFYWVMTAEALGPIHERQYVRGTTGVSVRIMRGVYARSAGSRGHYVESDRFGLLDTGRLLFSNVRLLFVGSNGGVAYAGYDSIVSVDALHEGFRISVKHGEPMTFRTGSPGEAIILRRLIAGDTADHRTPTPTPPAISS